jgi:hypothetical protein
VLARISKKAYHIFKANMEHTELARMGGKARAKSLTDLERSESARLAVTARWDRVRAERAALASKQAKRKRGRAGVPVRLQ